MLDDYFNDSLVDRIENIENRIDNIERRLDVLSREITKLPGRIEVIAAICLLVNFTLMAFL